MDCSTPGFPVHCQLLEITQTHVHWVSEAIRPSHPLSAPAAPAFNLSHLSGHMKAGNGMDLALGPEFLTLSIDSAGQGSLAFCSPWGHKGSNMTEQLNWYMVKKQFSLLMNMSSKFISKISTNQIYHSQESLMPGMQRWFNFTSLPFSNRSEYLHGIYPGLGLGSLLHGSELLMPSLPALLLL